MQSPITFCTHGDAVSGVPSVVTFRHVQDMISAASEASAADFFFACVVAARRGAGALRASVALVRIFERFPNASLQKRRPSYSLRKWRDFRLLGPLLGW